MLSYSGGTAPALHRLPCYALAGTRSSYSVFLGTRLGSISNALASTPARTPRSRGEWKKDRAKLSAAQVKALASLVRVLKERISPTLSG